jgi:hypothetical protein
MTASLTQEVCFAYFLVAVAGSVAVHIGDVIFLNVLQNCCAVRKYFVLLNDVPNPMLYARPLRKGMLAKRYRIAGAECVVLSAVLVLFWSRVQISSFPQLDVGRLEPAQLCRRL